MEDFLLGLILQRIVDYFTIAIDDDLFEKSGITTREIKNYSKISKVFQ